MMRQFVGAVVFFALYVELSGNFLLCHAGKGENNPCSIQDTLKSRQAEYRQPVYTTCRLSTPPPVIDGKLDDPCWKSGTWAGNFHQFIPDEGASPTYPSEMNIQFNDKYIYVAIRARDGEPGKIARLPGPRDEFNGDILGITFDSYRNYKTGFEFHVTAWGQKIDQILFNPMNWDSNWNAVWKAKTGMEDSAWVAEFEIPFSQLRYSNRKEQVWGMHVWRWIARLSEESDWEWQTKNGPGMLYNFGELRGIEGLKKTRRIEFMPFALGSVRTFRKEPGNPFAENGRLAEGNAGLDAKIGISSSFTLDLTVNPDFGQVESDPSVMNLTAFETFYDEKRPFFMEGLTIFDYKFDDQSLFYSRRIGHAPSLTLMPDDTTYVSSPNKTTILSALKLSGTTSNGLSVGFIQSLTANEKAQISNLEGQVSEKQVEPLTSYSVARIQKGYNAGNTFIGGMVTSVNRFINDRELEFLSRNALAGGLDFLHYWHDKEFYIDARLIGSYVNGSREAITALQESSARYFQRPGALYLRFDTTRTMLSGYGGRFRIGKLSTLHWKYSTGVSLLSPGLELNDLGYMTYADQIKNDNEITYQINKPVSIFHTYSLDLGQFNIWNFDRTFLGSGAWLSFYSEYRNNWTFTTRLGWQTNITDTRFLRGGPQMKLPFTIEESGRLSTDNSKKIVFNFSYGYYCRGNNSAIRYSIDPGISVRPLQVLKIGIAASIMNNHDLLQYITTLNYLSSERYIIGTLDQKTVGLTFRLELNITPEISIQYYGSPFISRGSFSDFKYITDPEAKGFNDRFRKYDNALPIDGKYGFDENGDMLPDYLIGNPDFNFQQFRSNLVAKWEYRPGSFIYLVWSGDMTGSTNLSGLSYGESLNKLFRIFPENVFLIKLSYWFSL
jgi:hypothetical protein